MNDTTPDGLARFIARWQAADGSELANYQLFVTELCELLDLPRPDPAREDTRDNAYVFERRIEFRHGDGSVSAGRIDCYRRAAFVLEAKKVRAAGAAPAYDSAMLRARAQAENYARALPAWEGRPPFLVVVDVGRSIELYAEFSRSGATYTPFPDPRSHRIPLAQLRDVAVRERLRALWLDPVSLDPALIAGKVTREIAGHLAGLARSLEEQGHHPETVAGFLTRCLFTLFAEDVGLLPPRAFSDLLETTAQATGQFVPLVGELWQAMDAGRFSVAVRAELLRFNGKLFKQPTVLPLDREQIGALLEAARAEWTQVEPAIFGTLLERALDPVER
ncbi:MAG: hypothetical protein H6R12_1642, partial [Proteobacteria bacterium]|nr:hypothetical protein [Pseudomonadota bacterium]